MKMIDYYISLAASKTNTRTSSFLSCFYGMNAFEMCQSWVFFIEIYDFYSRPSVSWRILFFKTLKLMRS